MLKFFKSFISIIGGGLIFMAQTPLQTTKTNLQSYLEGIGYSPDWVKYENIDNITTVFAIAAIIITFVLFRKPKAKASSQRTLNDAQCAVIKETCKFHNIDIVVNINDSEAMNLAKEIKKFLVLNDLNYTGMSACNLDGGGGDIVIERNQDSQDGITIIVPPNNNEPKPLRFTGGLAIGVE